MGYIKIQIISGFEFEIEGKVTKKVIDGDIIYYVNGESFPAEIVKEVCLDDT